MTCTKIWKHKDRNNYEILKMSLARRPLNLRLIRSNYNNVQIPPNEFARFWASNQSGNFEPPLASLVANFPYGKICTCASHYALTAVCSYASNPTEKETKSRPRMRSAFRWLPLLGSNQSGNFEPPLASLVANFPYGKICTCASHYALTAVCSYASNPTEKETKSRPRMRSAFRWLPLLGSNQRPDVFGWSNKKRSTSYFYAIFPINL